MTPWLYLVAFGVGTGVVWVGALRSGSRRGWTRVVLALVPPVLAASWVCLFWSYGVWTASLSDRDPLLVVSRLVVIAIVWVAGVLVWSGGGGARRASGRMDGGLRS